MKQYYRTIALIAFVLMQLLFVACTNKGNPVKPASTDTIDTIPAPRIQTAAPIQLSTTSIGLAGGNITISQAGSPIRGLEIQVPASSFAQTKTFTVSSSEIIRNNLGSNITLLSPLISVEYEGGYAVDNMSIKIPIKLPAGHFAMGFFCDPQTGRLEGIPVDSLDSTSITLTTRCFAGSSVPLQKRAHVSDKGSVGNMIVGSISESLLEGQTIITSGFAPGLDDWEFVNYGSYLAPGGHCAGQSMTAMWYYYEKKLKGAAPLFHLYDSISTKSDPDLMWQDNPRGYRFASTIQADWNWDNWNAPMNFRAKFPSLVFKAFAYSMLVTGEPQSVLIKNSKGLGAHAMIVYKVNFSEGKLYVADPNFPGNIHPGTKAVSVRTIDYVNEKFSPYYTGLTAGGGSIEMDLISYFGKTAMIEWDQVGRRFTEFENKTIGNDRFPAYTINIPNDLDKELTDKMSTCFDTLKVFCSSNGCAQQLPATYRRQCIDLYNSNGDLLASGDETNAGIATVALRAGSNRFGFHIMGAKDDKFDNYVDFKWVTINRKPLIISPDPLKGDTGQECIFTALSGGTAPEAAQYIWNFGDGTPDTTVVKDSTVRHRYAIKGTYSVKVLLWHGASRVRLTQATSSAVIGTPDSSVMSITPTRLAGLPNRVYTFTAMPGGLAPASARYVWNFGDGTAPITYAGDSTGMHGYFSEGEYTISVELFNATSNIKIAEAFASAIIKKPDTVKTVYTDSIYDVDGNVYHTVQIGNQIWTVENFRCTRYSDGSPIPLVPENRDWDFIYYLGIPSEAYCVYGPDYYGKEVPDKKEYGALYNWYAAGSGKLAPAGWRLPSDEDWSTLQRYLIANGYGITADTAIAKSMAAQTDWNLLYNIQKDTGSMVYDMDSGTIAYEPIRNNKSGFTALPAGFRNIDGPYLARGIKGVWWSSTEYNSNYASVCWLNYWDNNLGKTTGMSKSLGYSVRLVRDKEY